MHESCPYFLKVSLEDLSSLHCTALKKLRAVNHERLLQIQIYLIMASGWINEETGKWVELGYFPYDIIHKK